MIDLIIIALTGMAIYKGFSKGAIVALFSVLGWLVGLAAALKLSTLAAAWMGNHTNVNARWIPFLAFLGVFIAVSIGVRFVANLLEKAVELAWLGWANKLVGVACFLLLYGMGISIVLFYLQNMGLVSASAINQSRFWPILAPFGPAAVEGLGTIIPWFSDMFEELKVFFGQTANQLS